MGGMKKLKIRHFYKYIVVDILIAAVLSFFIITYLISAFQIKGNSMNPSLKNRERVIISKMAARRGKINRFDIVILYKPDEPNKSIIKRVVGLPEEIIELRNGELRINSDRIDQPHSFNNGSNPGSDLLNFKPLLIPRGHYFVLGDNRLFSLDSRTFGVVPSKYIYGKVILRYWPPSRLGKIE